MFDRSSELLIKSRGVERASLRESLSRIDVVGHIIWEVPLTNIHSKGFPGNIFL